MQAGKLDERITWQSFTVSQDSYGELIQTWADIATNPTVWASVQSRASGERFISSEQLMATVTHTVRIRYRDDLTVQMRGIWRNRYLYIENIIEFRRDGDLVLMCREEQF